MPLLTGKSVVVTGAGSGQGFATALAVAAEGGHVLAVDINEEGLSELHSADPNIVIRRCDVTNASDAESTIAAAEGEFGRIDALMNCAGILRSAPFEETSDEAFDLLVNVNLRGLFNMCRAAIPALRRNQGGSIVNWGSINSFVAEDGISVYSATKGAVLMLTKSIAIEYGKEDIRANCICPGAVKTPMVKSYFDDDVFADKEKQRHIQPLGFAEPGDIADVAVFLASDKSKLMTGSAVMVDGGFTAL